MKKGQGKINDELYFHQLNVVILLILILLILIIQTSLTFFTFDRLYRYIPSIVDSVCVSGSTQIDRSSGEKKKAAATPEFVKHRAITSLFLSILPPPPSITHSLIVEHGASCYLETSSADLDSSPPCNLAAVIPPRLLHISNAHGYYAFYLTAL